MIKRLGVLILLLNMTLLFCAGGVGTTGANYLKIGLGAKATAMGENFTGLADDTSAVYWNVAGLSKAKTSEVDFMQLNWVAGISAKSFLGVYPLSDTDFIGGYFFMLDTPTEKETRYVDTGIVAGEETSNTFKNEIKVLNIAYSKKISASLSAGLGLKSIMEDLAGTKANGLAVDAGLLYKDLYPNLSLGFAVQNMPVTKLRSTEDLPMVIAGGAAYSTMLYRNRLNIMADIKLPNDNDPRYGVGFEYWLADTLAGRIGYNTFHQFSLGVGVNLENLVADYAYVPLGDLGITHRFSVGYKFATILEPENKQVIQEPVRAEKPITQENVGSLFEEEKPIEAVPTVTPTPENISPVIEQNPVTGSPAPATLNAPPAEETASPSAQVKDQAELLAKFDF